MNINTKIVAVGRQEKLDDMVDKYMLAVSLANGPDPNRCTAWLKIAYQRERRLIRRLKGRGINV